MRGSFVAPSGKGIVVLRLLQKEEGKGGASEASWRVRDSLSSFRLLDIHPFCTGASFEPYKTFLIYRTIHKITKLHFLKFLEVLPVLASLFPRLESSAVLL